MFYLTVILVASVIVAFCNLPYGQISGEAVLSTLTSVIVGVVAVIIIDGISALVIRRLTPAFWYSADRSIFSVSKKEHRMYMKLKIKKWKDLVPELGLFTGFSKSELASISDGNYLERFILEVNYGVVIHLANGILGFLILFIPICSSPSVWVPIFIVNLILSLMPVCILRFNGYTLQRLYNRTKK